MVELTNNEHAKPHRLVWYFVFTSVLIACIGIISLSSFAARPAPTSTIAFTDLNSRVMESSVPVSVLLPPGFDPDQTTGLPFVIQLHGGASNRNQIVGEQRWIDELFADGTLPPVVFVMFSSSAFSGFLGPWEEFIASELPAWMSEHYHTRKDREGVVIAGMSMGGYGALKSAFRTPERFLAVGAMEPAVEPTLKTLPNFTRNSWSRGPAKSLSPSDKPARIAHDNAEAIRESGLEIYLEVGDEDFINLHDGAEFLHRVLWDHDIRHEYHLVRWADHVGESMESRYKEMHAFLAKALAGGRHDPVALPITEDEQKLLEAAYAKIQAGEPAPPELRDYMNGVRGPTINANFWNPLREAAAADPDLARAYAKLPPTSLDEDEKSLVHNK